MKMIKINDKFSIGKYPVTNTEYNEFEPIDYLPEKHSHPVVNVSWYQAMAYCCWLSAKEGKIFRLPAEDEWYEAAGGDGREYPWGDSFISDYCNTWESGIKDTTPVDKYSKGASPYGVADMAGNVWEWCFNWYSNSRNTRVLRGGSWDDGRGFARCARRYSYAPDFRVDSVGFRIVEMRHVK